MKLRNWWLWSVAVLSMVGCVRVTPNQPNQPVPTPVRPTPTPVKPQPIPPTQLSIFESEFNKIQPGWTAGQVETLLGKPWRAMPPDQRGHTYWHYRIRLEVDGGSVDDVDGEVEFNGSTVVGRVVF